MHRIVLATSLLLATPALAGEQDPRAVVEHIFEKADSDRSGALTAAEYEAAGLERFGVTFEQCDADADGETSLAEYLAIYDRHHPGPGTEI